MRRVAATICAGRCLPFVPILTVTVPAPSLTWWFVTIEPVAGDDEARAGRLAPAVEAPM